VGSVDAIFSCAMIAGDSVVNPANEDLGKLEHVMIDIPTGRIAYAVLACGGVFGIGAKLFAVPWGALTLDGDHQHFVLDIDKRRFEKAPGFDKDHWPAMADPAWASQIHDYYGVPKN
jgi:sporulation protein YlmC with PRC-barrel domain